MGAWAKPAAKPSVASGNQGIYKQQAKTALYKQQAE